MVYHGVIGVYVGAGVDDRNVIIPLLSSAIANGPLAI
jgi:hypothetical protein